MLVLSRKPGQRVFIKTDEGEELFVRVIRIEGGMVFLGFEADDSVLILREEIMDDAMRILRKAINE